jgi:hypothetical protein
MPTAMVDWNSGAFLGSGGGGFLAAMSPVGAWNSGWDY